MPVRIAQATTIARTPEQVWEFIADARNDPRWCEKVVSVDQVAGEGPGPNAQYRVMHRPRPRKPPVELAMQVVEFDPPHRLRWREEDPDAVFNVVYELKPDGPRTPAVRGPRRSCQDRWQRMIPLRRHPRRRQTPDE